MVEETGAIFNEVQYFRQLWLMAVVAVTAIVPILIVAVMLQQLMSAHPVGGAKEGLMVGLGILLLNAAIVWLLLASNLKTIVKTDGLYIRYYPFHRRLINIPLENVEKIESVTYSPLGEYGGWGIRYARNGRAYNPTGNRGVRITYKDGKHILIGSQKPDELLQAVQSIR